MRSSYFVMIISLDFLMMIQFYPIAINKQDKELLSVNIFESELFVEFMKLGI